jgi:hypothetical protein
MPQYDPIARKIYVNLRDQNIFAVVDPQSDRVVGRYSVGKCDGNHGNGPPDHRRAFLACEGNSVDQGTHRVYAREQEVDGHPAARMTVYEAVTGQSATLR